VTTSRSPLRVLKAQADKIAKSLKAAERGEPIAHDPTGKIAASIARGVFKTGIVMDDKIITVEMPWSMIRETGEVALSEYVLKLMRNNRNDA